MLTHSTHHAARGVEGTVTYLGATDPMGFDASSPIALVTEQDLAAGASAAALAACVLGVAIMATVADIDALLAAALRGCARHVVVARPASLADADMSACETFHVLASLGVAVFSADRGWLSPDDFGDGVLQPPGVDPVSPPDAAAALLEECA